MTYNSLQGVFTTMIGFVTWPPFRTIIFYKVYRWPSDKANHSYENALYVIQVKGFLIKCSISWPYLISEFLVAYNHCGF